ncbi:MAG: MbnP family protein [Bacteroidota bacterium]
MKKLNFLQLFTLVSILVVGVSSCDSDSFSGEIEMTFDLTVDGETFERGTAYTINGTTVEFDNMGFYVGGISFEGEQSTAVFQDKYLLVTPDNTSFNVGDLSKDTYNSISFFIGVDAATNSMSTEDFTTRPESDPLAAQEYQMHWNWNTGYKFFRIDGRSDTDGDGVVDTDITYHIGTNALLGNIQLPVTSLDEEVQIQFDIAAFFNGVDFTTDVNTLTGNNPELAQRLVANYAAAFSLQ